MQKYLITLAGTALIAQHASALSYQSDANFMSFAEVAIPVTKE